MLKLLKCHQTFAADVTFNFCPLFKNPITLAVSCESSAGRGSTEMQSLYFPNTKEGWDKMMSSAAVGNGCLRVKFTYLYPPQTLFVGGILFSRCPSVRASVRP